MGNASRISAIVESLETMASLNSQDIEISIFSWGAGYSFLRDFKEKYHLKFDLFEMDSYQFATVFKFLRKYFKNTFFLFKSVRNTKPDLIILDSDYHLLSYLFSPASRVYIGQAVDVVERAQNLKLQFKSYKDKINFFLREKLDSIFQYFISDVVFVPSFKQENAKCKKKIIKVPLIVRKDFLECKDQHINGSEVGCLLSGSEIEKDKFLSISSKKNYKVISPHSRDNFVISTAKELDQFDTLITQGGLSSISEAAARNIFLVIIPMTHHPEQYLNAIAVESLGLGVIAETKDLLDFDNFIDKIRKEKLNVEREKIDCSGAQKISSNILNLINSKSF